MVVVLAKLCPTLVIPWAEELAGFSPWDSPGKNTGVGCQFLLQEIFPTQGLNPGLQHCRQTHAYLVDQKVFKSLILIYCQPLE